MSDFVFELKLKPTLTQEKLKELLHYDPETGIFTWILRRKGLHSLYKAAGSINKGGYNIIEIYHISYPAHRLAWLYMYGYMSEVQIDHINLVRTDNRIINLREASQSQNRANASIMQNNKSGFKGVCWNKQNRKWAAYIRKDGRRTHLGYYLSAEEASLAYQVAATAMFGEFARG